MATIILTVGDEVFDNKSGASGIIASMYPEINTAIVRTPDNDFIKANLTDLYKVVYAGDEVVVKKRTLFDRIKGLFVQESYD